MSMNYSQTEEYSLNLSKRGSVLGLDNMKVLMHALSDVQNDLKCVHIAGTNGKGSVSAFLSSVLCQGGYKVGIYSSPAVFSPLEIIRIGKRNISKADYAACMSEVRDAAENGGIPVTLFEAQTAAAFLYFSKKACDIVILECGLGGATDATNIIGPPLVSVITTIGMDHSAILGKTLEEIAAKKAGIIKRGCVCVSSLQSEEVKEVLADRCRLGSVPFLEADAEKEVRILSVDRDGSHFRVTGEDGSFEDIRISLPGLHQIQNAYTAYKTLTVLGRAGFEVTDRALKKGFGSTVNPGRLERINESPEVIIDGAHNPDGAMALKEYTDTWYKNRRKIFLIGVFADKDYEGILRCMCDKADMVITLHTPDNPRALNSYELAKAALEYNSSVTAAASVEEAVELAFLSASKNDVIICFGSLSFLGRLKKAVQKLTMG